MRLLTAGEVCDVLSTRTARFPYQTLNAWIRRGIIRSVVQARGTGRQRMFEVVDIVAVAMGRGLRAKGFTLEAAGAVTEALMNFSEADLLGAFGQGRTFLMVVGDEVRRELVSRKEAVRQWDMDVPADNEIGLLPIALDVKRLYDNICRRVGKLESQRTAARGTGRHKKRTARRPVAKRKAAKRKKVRA